MRERRGGEKRKEESESEARREQESGGEAFINRESENGKRRERNGQRKRGFVSIQRASFNELLCPREEFTKQVSREVYHCDNGAAFKIKQKWRPPHDELSSFHQRVSR